MSKSPRCANGGPTRDTGSTRIGLLSDANQEVKEKRQEMLTRWESDGLEATIRVATTEEEYMLCTCEGYRLDSFALIVLEANFCAVAQLCQQVNAPRQAEAAETHCSGCILSIEYLYTLYKASRRYTILHQCALRRGYVGYAQAIKIQTRKVNAQFSPAVTLPSDKRIFVASPTTSAAIEQQASSIKQQVICH
jgi:hypothetical protein